METINLLMQQITFNCILYLFCVYIYLLTLCLAHIRNLNRKYNNLKVAAWFEDPYKNLILRWQDYNIRELSQ